MDLGKLTTMFDPEDREHRWKLWVRVGRGKQSAWHVYWGRLAAVLAGLAVAGWCALAGGAWAFVKYNRGYAQASYLDLVFYPWRAREFRSGLAAHYLEAGRREIEQQKYLDGYWHLVAGLQWHPADLAARRTVAEMQLRFGLGHRALQTLEEGLPYRPDLDYLKFLFGSLLQAKEDDRVLALAHELLPAQPDEVREHQFVALEAATAHFERGHYDEAEKIVGSWRLVDALEGQILLARCDWERGLPEQALARLEAQIARFPRRDELFLALVRFNREFGRTDEARRYALLRYFNGRAEPGPRLDLMTGYHASGEAAAEARERDQYFADFKGNAAALNLIGWYAVDTLEPGTLERARALVAAQGFPLREIDLARVQLALARRDFRGALALADEAAAGQKEPGDEFATSLDGLRALAEFGLKDSVAGENLLASYLAHARLRATDALYLARHLELLGVPDAARAVLDRACALDPRDQATLTQLVRLEAAAGNRAALAEHLPRLLAMAKPARAVLAEAMLALDRPEDGALRAELRAAIAGVTGSPAPRL